MLIKQINCKIWKVQRLKHAIIDKQDHEKCKQLSGNDEINHFQKLKMRHSLMKRFMFATHLDVNVLIISIR